MRLPKHVDQHQVMQRMLDDGVATRRGVMCAHLEPAYQAPNTWRCAESSCKPSGSCPNLIESERAQNEGVILPLFAEISSEDQEKVAQSLRRALAP